MTTGALELVREPSEAAAGAQPAAAPTAPGARGRPTRHRYEALKRGRRAAGGPSEADVGRHQRLRLYGAMIELVAERGYARASTRELARIAAVSKNDMYRHFATKEEYFLATYDFVARSAARATSRAEQRGADWRQRLANAFAAYAKLACDQQPAAKLALVEVLAAGETAWPRMARARGVFEQMLSASLQRAGAAEPPPPLVKAIACGIERVTRSLLLAGELDRLPALVPALLDWTLALCGAHAGRTGAIGRSEPSPSASARRKHEAMGRTREHARSSREPAGEPDERTRLLHAAASLAARHGYSRLTPSQVLAHSGVADDVLEALYPRSSASLLDCFLDAHDLLCEQLLADVGRAVNAAGGPATGEPARAALAALLRRVAEDPVLARVVFHEALAPGPAALPARERFLTRLAAALAGAMPARRRPPEIVLEAAAGGIWGVVHHYVAHRSSGSLPTLSDLLAPLLLAAADLAQGPLAADRERQSTQRDSAKAPEHLA